MVLTSPYGNVWMFTDGVMARASPKQRNKLTIQNIAISKYKLDGNNQ